MRRDGRFWRNVALITVVHLAALIALLRWAGASKIERAQEITWLNIDNDISGSLDSLKREETLMPAKPPPPEENPTVPAPATSEIQLPTATPQPTPSASATPKPSPKPSPTPTPKKKPSAKPAATPEKKRSKAEATPAEKKKNAKKLAAKKGEGRKSETKSAETAAKTGSAARGSIAGGRAKANATSASTDAGWYGDMLHDRFYREWAQPTTVVASGAKLSALAKIRIEKDGRISDFKIVRSSGNVVVDESVAAVGQKVTRVDSLPAGLGNGAHYDVNINFALNSR